MYFRGSTFTVLTTFMNSKNLMIRTDSGALKNELVVLSPEKPTFKYMTEIQLESPHALFSGHFAVEDQRGREYIIGMPSHRLHIENE